MIQSILPVFAQAGGFDPGDAAVGGGVIAGLIAAMLVPLLIAMAIMVFVIIGLWKIFTKAGKPGWASIVPIYNLIVLAEIVGRPTWWGIVAAFVPCVNVVFICIMYVDLAKSFGKDVGYAIGMIILPMIFIPMLGFGSAKYLGPSAPQM